MGALTDQRQTLADDLAATGLMVYPAWPGRLDPPCIVLVPALPWIDSRDVTFTHRRGHLSVHIFAGPGDASDSLAALETAVESVLVHSADWSIESVDAPTLVTLSGADYLATTLNCSKPFRLPNP